ncbi:helix-turn-helix domain-containing protein [Micromonospora sp. NPDC000207]|uniref:helix-turn-helix domain-containing protein n=1 Tax=Micromonospora sp. NPDC000207 TaxID=3154246 RepID=UPI00333045BF
MTGPDHNSLPIGRRVAYWRGRRNLSQQVFADRIGKSKSWVDKVERGIRRLDRVSVLDEIAEALRIDVSLLLDPVGERRVVTPGDDLRGAVARVRTALARHDPAPRTPSVAELQKAVRHGWSSLRYGRLLRLLGDLPRLLAGLRHIPSRDLGTAAQVVSQAYQLAATVLRRVGAWDAAWLAADRAMTVGAGLVPVLAARAAVPLGGVVRDLGQPRAAYELCVSVAHDLAPPDPYRADPDHLSVYGSLLLQAAMAAAQLGDRHSVAELVDQAADVAEWVGVGLDHHDTAFGPPLVDGVRVAAALALGDVAEAVIGYEAATTRPGYVTLPAGVRADHLIDVAGAYAHLGDLDGAGWALLGADRLAPDEIRLRPAGRATVASVLRRSHPPDPRLAALGEALGLDGAR